MTEMLNDRISEMIKNIGFGLYAGDKFGKSFLDKIEASKRIKENNESKNLQN